MSADRLREAADQIDRGWDLAQRRISPMVAESWGVITDVDRRTAALLRAVAEYQNDQDRDDYALPCAYCYADKGQCERDCPQTAAEALADVILGGAE